MNSTQAAAVTTPLETLESALGASWLAIRQARMRTHDTVRQLKDALKECEDNNCSVIVTGSLGRGEATDGSDADWVLLVDGPADPGHAKMAKDVAAKIKTIVNKDVGRTGTFGNIVASHDLVHYIAGTRDTNENLTRRILLLSESRALTNSAVRERVIGLVLDRYVRHDRSVRRREAKHYNQVPHFLLNDVVRYWRTMASDYASKMWERSREGWGTRNIKLRFSRKLLFIWGLFASFAGRLFNPSDAAVEDEDEFLATLTTLIKTQTEITPLDLLAVVASHESVQKNTAREVFSAYDKFLSVLSDPAQRDHLEKLPFENATTDELYNFLRDESDKFRSGINAIFFDEHTELKSLIREYGVF